MDRQEFIQRVVYLLYYIGDNTAANELQRLEEEFELDYAFNFAVNSCRSRDLFNISRGRVNGSELEEFVNNI